ncbi:hypothetical protein ACIA5G_25500 [Amycolatopsis sp. NPDC051758]|uniref:hypothetical protein n=1 Tax=Amycolatopsis sp. NPDC051758 TaxID=3363935 RepID=UPI003789EF47
MKARSRLFRAIALTATATVACLLPVSASADTGASAAATSGDFGPAAAGDRVQRSGTHSHDLTGDGVPDLLARQPDLSNGSLWVYTGSGKLQGTSTFTAKTLVRTGMNSFNWVGTAEVTPNGDSDEFEKVAEPPADLIGRRESDGALFVYPHSGTFNGGSTFKPAVQVGTGWNSMVWMTLADVTTDGFDDIISIDAQDNMWVYPHSGTFNGTSTFKARVQVRKGRPLWNLMPTWSRENADMVGASTATGEMIGCAHTNKFNGLNTFHTDCKTLAPVGTFAQPTTSWISLADADGSGTDDVIKRLPNGQLTVYPFLGWNHNPVLGSPVVVGSGWNSMDLIT